MKQGFGNHSLSAPSLLRNFVFLAVGVLRIEATVPMVTKRDKVCLYGEPSIV